PGPIPIGPSPYRQGDAAIGFGSGNYLVAYHDSRLGGGIYGARLAPNGEVLDPNGIPISGVGSERPAVAFDGANYLVAWNASSGLISGARMSPDGTVLDPDGIPISAGPNDSQPAVAFDGTNSLV